VGHPQLGCYSTCSAKTTEETWTEADGNPTDVPHPEKGCGLLVTGFNLLRFFLRLFLPSGVGTDGVKIARD